MSKNYVGDIGVLIRVDCGTDITAATVTEMKVKKPDDTTVTWIASIADTQYLEYTTDASTWDQAGFYYLQAYVETPTYKILGDTVCFQIYDPYK